MLVRSIYKTRKRDKFFIGKTPDGINNRIYI